MNTPRVGDRFALRVRLATILGEKFPGVEETDEYVYPDTDAGRRLGLGKNDRAYVYEVYRVGPRHVWLGHSGSGLRIRPLRRMGLSQFRKAFADAEQLVPWKGLEVTVSGRKTYL